MIEEDSIDSDQRRKEKYSVEENKNKEHNFIVPNSKEKLRACIRCHLIKTEAQWVKDERCENCGEWRDDEYKNKTSPRFENVVAVIDPSKSWLRRKLRLGGKNLVSGSYAIVVQ